MMIGMRGLSERGAIDSISRQSQLYLIAKASGFFTVAIF